MVSTTRLKLLLSPRINKFLILKPPPNNILLLRNINQPLLPNNLLIQIRLFPQILLRITLPIPPLHIHRIINSLFFLTFPLICLLILCRFSHSKVLCQRVCENLFLDNGVHFLGAGRHGFGEVSCLFWLWGEITDFGFSLRDNLGFNVFSVLGV